MRYGVVADVHGNLTALETVLAALERESVDRFVCPGDLVGFGPRPDECVARIAALDALVVAGNHDLMAVGRLSSEGLGPFVRRSLEWTRQRIDAQTTGYLEALPLTAETADGVVVAHGSLDDPTEYVRDCAAGEVQLARLRAGARGLVLGHTHLPLQCWAAGEPWLLNPGSVGQSRERRALARAAVLDSDSGAVKFLALEYDVRATRRDLRAAGLPATMCHLHPGRFATLRRRVAALTAAIKGQGSGLALTIGHL